MQKYQKNFIGIDVSKPYFDTSLLVVIDSQKQEIKASRFSNSAEGLKMFLKWLKQSKVSMDNDTLVVIENTGIYHRLLWKFCCKNNLTIHIGNATHIKWSFGIARGKNDVIDSKRLCNYAYTHCHELKATPQINLVFLKLKDFMASRTKLLQQKNSIKTYLNELKLSNDKSTQRILEQGFKASLEGIIKSIKVMEIEIEKIITQDSEIQKNYDLMITVPGIGKYTALYILCCTNNFEAKITGKQLASYAGVVPFEHSSGISIKGKNHVHKMANKNLKKMLHLCALTTIRYYPEFKDYFDRKKLEGKNKKQSIVQKTFNLPSPQTGLPCPLPLLFVRCQGW